MEPFLTPRQLASLIDYSFLRPDRQPGDIELACEQAMRYGFNALAIHPAEIETCRRLLSGSRVKVDASVGFPLGQNTPPVKEHETQDAIQRGAQEIDLVINIRALQSGRLEIVRQELAALARLCRVAGVTSKVILETCYLSDEEKRLACQIALEEGVDFVKTSTGRAPGGATLADVRLMRAVVGDKLGVKAAGGIRTLEQALAMIQAGANRLGTSSALAIIDEAKKDKV
jgi:deoxyribose-phosphate aldolase